MDVTAKSLGKCGFEMLRFSKVMCDLPSFTLFVSMENRMVLHNASLGMQSFHLFGWMRRSWGLPDFLGEMSFSLIILNKNIIEKNVWVMFVRTVLKNKFWELFLKAVYYSWVNWEDCYSSIKNPYVISWYWVKSNTL